MDVAADQVPGIGRTGMISTDSPGKIVKCGCFSNSLAAASCDSARTTMKAPISLLTSAMPRSVIFFVLPSGPPMAETAAWCFSILQHRHGIGASPSDLAHLQDFRRNPGAALRLSAQAAHPDQARVQESEVDHG